MPCAAEERWDFSLEAFGGKAYLEDNDVGAKCQGCAFDFDATKRNVKREDPNSWGGRVAAWYLPTKHTWQPQVGFGLDWTRFTADVPGQHVGGTGSVNIPGMQVVGFTVTPQQFSVDIATIDLMFRYPIWATPDLPQGRLAPYVGVGGGVQRALLTDSSTGLRKINYAPAYEAIAGVKFFVFRHFAIFGEFKRTTGEHTFKFDNVKPVDYQERHTITANHLLAGVAVHF